MTAELSRRRVILATAGTMLALLLAALDQTIVGTAIPRIVAELNGLDRLAWVTTAYLVTSTTMTRSCDSPVERTLSIASTATLMAESNPNVRSVAERSLSIVFGTPRTLTPSCESA